MNDEMISLNHNVEELTPNVSKTSLNGRWDRVKRFVKEDTPGFLGILPNSNPVSDFSLRRLRLASRRCGELKCHQGERSRLETFPDVVDAILSSVSKGSDGEPGGIDEFQKNFSSSSSRDLAPPSSTTSSHFDRDEIDALRKLSTRESVPAMAWDGLTHLCHGCIDKLFPPADGLKCDKSVLPQTQQEGFTARLRSRLTTPRNWGRSRRTFTLVPPTEPKPPNNYTVDKLDGFFRREGNDEKTLGVLATTSYMSDDVFQVQQDNTQLATGIEPKDEVIFRRSATKKANEKVGLVSSSTATTQRIRSPIPDYDDKQQNLNAQNRGEYISGDLRRDPKPDKTRAHPDEAVTASTDRVEFFNNDRIRTTKAANNKNSLRNRLTESGRNLINQLLRRPSLKSKRYIGQGIVMDILHHDSPGYNERVWSHPELIHQIRSLEDYRPFFTYWITCIQILVTLGALLIYGIGPLGFNLRQREKVLLKPSLSLEKAGFLEPENFWIGPTPFALIHLGAKYPPCMRRDPQVWREIEVQRSLENLTACCIRKDGSGCIQTSWEECQDRSFYEWISQRSNNNNLNKAKLEKLDVTNAGLNYYSVGTVCGLDPAYCLNPLSTSLRPWPNDLTFWPICKNSKNFQQSMSSPEFGADALPAHMKCDLIGKPCCIGIRGSCIITTQEYCQFVRGHFHEEAHLCSQVDCLSDICGMLPFATTRYISVSSNLARNENNKVFLKPIKIPDQIYRLWVSIFLHAGLIQLLITVCFQMVIVRDLEKLAGPIRIGLIYFVSGIGGNLGSAIFLPDRADAGPAGAQFGILACLLVELFQNWQILRAPSLALIKMLLLYAILVLLGFLPWIDNFSHIFGFTFGFLLSFCLMPYLTFGHFDRKRKLVTLFVSAFLVITLYTIMLLVFYRFPQASYACKYCKYFDCIPIERDFCNNHEIRINQ